MELKKISSDVKLGKNVTIHDFTNLYGCEIGDNSKVGAFVEIQKNVKVGKNVKVSTHTFICEGVTIEDNVFIGHNVSFINDKYPRSTNEKGELQTDKDWKVVPTLVKKGASSEQAPRFSAASRSVKMQLSVRALLLRKMFPRCYCGGCPCQSKKEKIRYKR